MADHSEHCIEDTSNKKSLKAYVIGFILCVVLTLVAFDLVEKRLLSNTNLYIALAGLAVTQLFVQCICFLGLNNSKEGRWNLLPFLFAIFIIAILVSGSLWIMYNLNFNMMH